jgi:hypothetical protein
MPSRALGRRPSGASCFGAGPRRPRARARPPHAAALPVLRSRVRRSGPSGVRRRPRPPPEAARDRVPGCPAGRASPSCRGAGSSSAPSLGSGATDGWRRCRASRSIRRSHYLPRHDQGDPMASLQKPNLPAQTLTPPVRAPRRRPPAGWPVPPRSAEHLPPAPRRHSRGHGPPRCGRSRPPARS